MKTKVKKPTSTFDGKPLKEIEDKLEVKFTYSNSMTLLLATELATGEYNKKKFTFLFDITGRGFRLNYGDNHITIRTSDLVDALMDTMMRLNDQAEAITNE